MGCNGRCKEQQRKNKEENRQFPRTVCNSASFSINLTHILGMLVERLTMNLNLLAVSFHILDVRKAETEEIRPWILAFYQIFILAFALLSIP